MPRYKLNIKTCIIAAMVVLLCFASITGATYALFTSSIEDGTIGVNVTSGDLEVDIIDASDTPDSLVGDVLDFVTTSENKEVLFEPGATYYTEGFRVKNNGSIPLNYILYISEDETVSAEFSEAFEVWLTKNPKDKANMVKLQEFKGSLTLGEASDVYYLVFRMKETAGNEFQNKAFTGVGITVCAVQGNVVID